ncbi:Hsp20/alpha crystallin family protein [Shouchella lonarensis]|uniref:Molecular chaperone IbpA, HSP20 family n=1 Tax=Shouchella lonarensis TaxID=1464122 RepID=A0A1G6HC94_9BACI|nr:Hsp20/alpha crystallin family protein [Shouchella lonarensis]SDB91764.1 Molecular chaperone IbpA, HSP20 family [Shouchella lonarensis]
MHKDHTSLSKRDQATAHFLASIDQFFQSAFEQFTNMAFEEAIPIQTSEESGYFVVEAQLGNVMKEQIDLEVAPQALIIRVRDEHEFTTLDDQTEAISYQRQSHSRERIVNVPFPFSEEDVRAQFEAPQLTVFISGRRKTIFIT